MSSPRTWSQIRAVAVVAVSAALSLAYGNPYGSGNQVTYLLEPVRRAAPALYAHDWLVASTTPYHPVFSWLIAPIYRLGPGAELAFELGQLVAMIATFALIYRLCTLLGASPRHRLAMFALLVGLLALGGSRALAGSYLYAGYLQPSSLATLGWLAAMLAWLRGQHLRAGLWLALGGVFHVNFVVLGIAVFGALELSAPGALREAQTLRRLAAVLGPSLVVLAGFVPALVASGPAAEPELALRILSKFHAPGHYDPARVRRWLPPLVAWLAIAWGALPALPRGDQVVRRLWRFAAVATALCIAATAIASLWLAATRLYVWRIAPFGQLAAQLVIVAAALAPPDAAPRPALARRVALIGGAAVLVVESAYLGGGHYVYTAALGCVAAVWLVARSLRRPALACALAVSTLAIALVGHRDELRDPPLFAGECWNADCELLRWVRGQTSVDAVFLVPPYVGWFRLLAQRAIVADTKSPPLYPDELVAWYRRLCAMVSAPEMPTHEAVEERWDHLTADQIAAAARRFEVDYVVLVKPRSAIRLAQPVAFESAEHIVYRLR